MKKLLFFVTLLYSMLASAHQVTASVDGISDKVLKEKIERSISSILSEVNAAQDAHRNLDFTAMGVTGKVSESMAMLWENTPFTCPDEEIVEHCIKTGSGYQVRNIPLYLTPQNGEKIDEDDIYQEAVVGFDRNGNVESFYLTISTNLYKNIISSNLEVKDLRRRQMILDYVEQFRTAYNQKDINFLDMVFSDDALIITGKVITRTTGDGIRVPDVEYKKQTKQQYLKNLRNVFNTVKYIKVNFDDIEVKPHPIKDNIYGVTLHQGYATNRYSDEGYVFLLWDFTNESNPKIHVRTWQPTKVNGKTVDMPREKVFTLADFDI